MNDRPDFVAMAEWAHNIGNDANFSEGYDDTDWGMLRQIETALRAYPALMAEMERLRDNARDAALERDTRD